MADSKVIWGDPKYNPNDLTPLYDKAGKNIKDPDYFAPDTDYYTRIGTKMGGTYSTPVSPGGGGTSPPPGTDTNLTPPGTDEDLNYWIKRRSLIGITDESVI